MTPPRTREAKVRSTSLPAELGRSTATASRVNAVEMRSGADEPEHVVNRGSLVAVATPGAVELISSALAAPTRDDQVPPEGAVTAGDAPPAGSAPSAFTGRRMPTVEFGHLSNVETVRQRTGRNGFLIAVTYRLDRSAVARTQPVGPLDPSNRPSRSAP